MLHPRAVPASLFVMFLGTGCGTSLQAGPAAVVEQFFQALARNDLPAARQLLAAKERDDATWNLDSGPAKQGFSVGPCRIDGETAVVPVELGEPKTTIPHVLVREEGAWRLSLQQTSLRMTGFDPAKLRQQIQDQLTRIGTGVQGTVARNPQGRQAAAPR